MEVNAYLIKMIRQKRGWTQQQLADISDVNLRTIQRIEKTGSASNESVSAICTSFEIQREALLIVPRIEVSDLRPAQIGRLYLMLVLAMIVGSTLGALTMYWLMVK